MTVQQAGNGLLARRCCPPRATSKHTSTHTPPPQVTSTIEIYNRIRAELLPTPSRSHYTFNLRDLSKVVQGVMRADPRGTGSREQLLALWLHETSRVFEDR